MTGKRTEAFLQIGWVKECAYCLAEENLGLEMASVGLGNQTADVCFGEGRTHDGGAHVVSVPVFGEELAGGFEFAKEGCSGVGNEPGGLKGGGVSPAQEVAAKGYRAPGIFKGFPRIAEHQGNVNVQPRSGGHAGALHDLFRGKPFVQAC